jgi:hypothetical protein
MFAYIIIFTHIYIQVEIFRDEKSLFRYLVPWKTRKTGFTLTDPAPSNDPEVHIYMFAH